MSNFLFKSKTLLSDAKNRSSFRFFEIFSFTGCIFEQLKFSNNLKYFLFKRRKSLKFSVTLKNRCLFTGNSRMVFSKYKMSRHTLFKKIKQSDIIGFYKSV